MIFFVENEQIAQHPKSQMNFLSTVTNQLPVAVNEARSNVSGEDLNISDDSVLDELYAGLPPWLVR